ncbi:pyrroline-5-carboxylate reductase [Robertmurraya yapensis]|uniref:Pyrroline-5-carboxylate reductase n=2 Tax=Bacillaceae TaxID=186817 RepID=A0A431VXJ4_9BACI|nr:pyrroline-5-carboxylate reductase [Bacillus yapensis]RTR27875.1 pyrroline-5-carboxylate reductase [Bacillus yapensis]TKS94278.1 pyrroline-5-carboxylate reductase [Bacillus yapensis]
MNKKIGFIGSGKMAQAMIKGILSSATYAPEQIKVSAKSDETLNKVKRQYSVHATKDNTEVARWADILFLAVKPDIHKEVIQEINAVVAEHTIIITVAAGITLDDLESDFGKKIKAVRTMPNTPSFVGEGMSALSINDRVTSDDLEQVLAIFRSFGEVEVVAEKLMDSIPAISGSSPAYVYMFIEALADGGVKDGIPREQAYRLAAQAVLGAAKMVLETGMHPGELKDQVCTPGGATIEAVSALELNGFRSAVLQAMESCTKKIKNL